MPVAQMIAAALCRFTHARFAETATTGKTATALRYVPIARLSILGWPPPRHDTGWAGY